MKIRRIVVNKRRKAFEVHTHRAIFSFPFAVAKPAPTRDDPVESAFVDPEVGREGFTYALASGREGTIHVDAVLEYNRDPATMADLMLYELTLEARRRLDRTRLGTREIIRRLGTSASQFYRLLDPANDRKSLRQMVALLAVLGCDVELKVKARA